MTLTIETLNIGTTAGDGTGDTLRAAAGKTNTNFSAIKTAVEALQALNTVLTGFSASAGVVAATDSVLIAFNKIVGNLAAWRVPAGGTTGQVLTKASATDNDVSWTTVSGAGSGETNTASNVGGGSGLFKQKTGVDLEFKTLVAGSGITLTPAASEVTIAVGAAESAGIPVTTVSANTTTTLAHANGLFYHPSTDTTARTITIDSNANVAYALGTSLTFDNDINAGTLTIAITSDTLVLVGSLASTGSRTLIAGGRATAVKVATTRWRISGVSLT